jgi:flagellar basal-body rod protein FlgG
MLEGLYSAAAGMSAQQEQLDAISNDLANLSSSGYKAERVAFGDLLYNAVDEAGTVTSAGGGASAQTIGRSETQGAMRETGQPLNLAIEGEGYFQVTLAGGQTALTRDGTFGVDAGGAITNAQGDRLNPPIKLPAGVSPSEVRIAPDGSVTAGSRSLGRIALVTVPAPAQLLANGSGVLLPTSASGTPRPASTGTIHQGMLEQSNVDISKEMAQMVSTQRSYQMTSSAIQTESQMMSIANQLRVP